MSLRSLLLLLVCLACASTDPAPRAETDGAPARDPAVAAAGEEADEEADAQQEPSVPERVARGAASEAGKRTQSRVKREYRSLIDSALDRVMGVRKR